MFCTKCGTENPDGTSFCSRCGSPLSAQPMQPVQPQQQFQQPFYGQQPLYGVPGYPQQGMPNKSKTVPIVIAVCTTVLAIFLVLLFTVIIPSTKGNDSNNGGTGNVAGNTTGNNAGNNADTGSVRSRLAHRWSYSGGDYIIDLKNNTYTEDGITVRLNWDVQGNNIMFEYITDDYSFSEEFTFSLSSDGYSLTLTDEWGDSIRMSRTD